MKQVVIQKGEASLKEVPAPHPSQGRVLVATRFSCVSPGTELSSVANTSQPLWKRALRNPEEIKKGLRTVADLGLDKTRHMISNRLALGAASGYSLAGEVLEAGEGTRGFKPGDRVACAGAGYAMHAQYVTVPENLVVPIPTGLDLAPAATVALGAIAMQGVRRADPLLGETLVVMGLGALGQLTLQVLKANGCVVIGIEPDPRRGRNALELGLSYLVNSGAVDVVQQVMGLTQGRGADAVIITAATSSSQLAKDACRMCRHRGRVVVVGDVGMELAREELYRKEISFLMSTSYGPGRYDPRYEEEGQDYPLPYVRWTERRNMEQYLRMLAQGSIRLDTLIGGSFPLERVSEAYSHLQDPETKPVMVLLQYPNREDQAPSRPDTRLNLTLPARAKGAPIPLALVGAGGFARGVHLPNLQKLTDLFELSAVISRTGNNARTTAQQYGAKYCGTDFQQVLDDPQVKAVLIATRHNLHASLALAALRTGKHVLLEKPLALTAGELAEIEAFYKENSSDQAPLLFTSFNRRFSPHIAFAAAQLEPRRGPMVISYRMNAGYIPPESWVHGPEGGGRNLGEACHIYDLFTFLTGARARSVRAMPIATQSGHYSPRDNFVVVISFDDGSVGSLTYTAMGSNKYPKESMEIFGQGKVVSLSNYRSTQVYGAGGKSKKTSLPEKGQREALLAFGRCIEQGGPWPIPLWQQFQATRLALEVEQQLAGREEPWA